MIGSFACFIHTWLHATLHLPTKRNSTTFQRLLVNPGPALVGPNHRQHLSEMVTSVRCSRGTRKTNRSWMTYVPKKYGEKTRKSLRISRTCFLVCGVYSRGVTSCHIPSIQVSLQSDTILQTDIAMQIPIVQQDILQIKHLLDFLLFSIAMLEHQSVDVGADILFIALPCLRCWIQHKEHAASNLCRCRCTRNRTPSTTLAKWLGMPNLAIYPSWKNNSSIPFNGDHESSKADFPTNPGKTTLPSLSTAIMSLPKLTFQRILRIVVPLCLTSSYLFIHFELINDSPIDIMVPLAPKPSDAVALQAISQCGDLPRSRTMLYPFWLESS